MHAQKPAQARVENNIRRDSTLAVLYGITLHHVMCTSSNSPQACNARGLRRSRLSEVKEVTSLRFTVEGSGIWGIGGGGGVHCFSAKFKALKLETYGDGLGVQGV